MSVTRVGATKQYSDNWENIFTGKRAPAGKSTPAKAVRQSAKKKPGQKKAASKMAKKASRRK
jgi:hypothetical protein